MLVIGDSFGEEPPAPPASIAFTPGPYASGYVMPAPGSIPASPPAKRKHKAKASSSSSSTALATTTAPGGGVEALAERLKSVPMVVWILLGLSTLAGIWWYTGKGRKGRRRRGGRPFARGRRG